tara:strand:+ start:191 stop:709 length:519 start_codon:yes stop_codon:yes gene_type:complete
MNRNRFVIWEIVLPLVVACFLYLLFRPVDTVVFKIASFFRIGEIFESMRLLINHSFIPSWVIYSLPGGLWLLAFQNTIALLKQFSIKHLLIPVLFAYGIGVGLEFLQYIHVTDGRFDWLDVLFYTIATITSLSTIFLINNKWEFYAEEKTSMKLSGFFYLFFVVIIYLADIV